MPIVDRWVSDFDEPYRQESYRDKENRPICKSCYEGRHPHKGHDCKILIPEGQCCCTYGYPYDKRN